MPFDGTNFRERPREPEKRPNGVALGMAILTLATLALGASSLAMDMLRKDDQYHQAARYQELRALQRDVLRLQSQR